jgi:hypothetical protein
MITAAEYRAWAEESLEWARIATKESSRAAYIQWAETWLELASRVERLTAFNSGQFQRADTDSRMAAQSH